MTAISKLLSIAQKRLEKAVAKSKKTPCAICGYRPYKVVWEANVNNIKVRNVPHSICPDCGAEYVDDDVLRALALVLDEIGPDIKEYSVPQKYTGHYFKEVYLS